MRLQDSVERRINEREACSLEESSTRRKKDPRCTSTKNAARLYRIEERADACLVISCGCLSAGVRLRRGDVDAEGRVRGGAGHGYGRHGELRFARHDGPRRVHLRCPCALHVRISPLVWAHVRQAKPSNGGWRRVRCLSTRHAHRPGDAHPLRPGAPFLGYQCLVVAPGGARINRKIAAQCTQLLVGVALPCEPALIDWSRYKAL